MPDAPRTVRDYVRQQAARWRVPEELAFAVIDQESGGVHQPAGGDVTTSSQNARGLFQVLPETARGEFNLDANDPLQNVEAGIRYLRQGLDRNAGDVDRALAHYFGGPDLRQHGPLTQQYVKDVKGKFITRLGAAPTSAPRAPLTAARNPIGPPLAAAGHLPAPSATTGLPPPVPDEYLMYAPETMSRGPGISAASFVQRHPFLMAYNPLTPMGRRNFGSGLGSIVGGIAGAAFGGAGATATVPTTGGASVPAVVPAAVVGGKVGSALGAGAGGAGAQLLEETRLFGPPLLPEPPPSPPPLSGAPPPPNAADLAAEQAAVSQPYGTGLERAVRVGAEETGLDIAGQGLMYPVKRLARGVVQAGVGRHAQEYFTQAKTDAVEALYRGLDAAKTALADLRLRSGQATRAATEAATRTGAETAEQVAARVARVKAGQGAQVRGVIGGARGAVEKAEESERLAQETKAAVARWAAERHRGVLRAGAADVRAARKTAATAITDVESAAQRAQEETAGAWSSLVGQPPSEALAGRQVAGVFHGPAQEAYQELGERVRLAAAQGPAVELGDLQNEIRDIVRNELLPKAVHFPRATPDPTSAVSQDALALGLQGVTDAQLDELKREPAMGILAELLHAPPLARFADIHRWVSDLSRALNVKGVYGRLTNSKLDSLTKHVAGELRLRLRQVNDGEGYAPFEQAAAAYADASTLMRGDAADLIKSVAVDKPERIVQAISLDDPTATRMVVDVLTGKVGGETVARAGSEALQRVQQAWIYRNLLSQGWEGLSERLTKLRTSPNYPDFADAFLNDDYSRGVMGNLDALSAAMERDVQQQLAARTAAEAGGAAQIEAAQELGRTAADRARATGQTKVDLAGDEVARAQAATRGVRKTTREEVDAARLARQQAIDSARALGSQQQREVAEAGRESVEAARRVGERERLAGSQQVQAGARAVRERKTLRTPEEEAFRVSTVSPASMREARRSTTDALLAATRAAVVAFGGYKALGPLGSFLGVAGLHQLGRKPTEADLLNYVVHSPWLTRQVVNHLAASRKPGFATTQVLKGVREAVYPSTPPPPPPGEAERR